MSRFLTISLMLALAGPVYAQDAADPEPAATAEEDPEPSEVDPFEELDEDPSQFEPRRQEEERPLELMTRDELETGGFEFGEDADGRDSSSALLLAVSAGTLVHGIGHLYLGDSRTGGFLLALEGASVGMMLGAITFHGLTESASPWTSAFGPLLQAGLATFVFTYLADVLGTVTIEEEPLKRNSMGERGIGFEARYAFFSSSGLPVRHAIDGKLRGDAGFLYATAATTQDVFLDLASYRGRVGLRLIRGREPLTFLGVEGAGDYLSWQGTGEFGRIGAEGRVVASYQLGNRVPHLGEFAMTVSGGLGNHWLQLAPAGSTVFELASSRLWIPFDAHASLNVSRHLNVRGGYGSPEALLVPALHPLLGVAHVDFIYRSDSIGDLSLRAEVGDGFAIWLGGGVWFGN